MNQVFLTLSFFRFASYRHNYKHRWSLPDHMYKYNWVSLNDDHKSSLLQAMTSSSDFLAKTIEENKEKRLRLCRGRSLIGTSSAERDAAKALGLNKTHRVKYVKIEPQVLGNVVKILHLLKPIRVIKKLPEKRAPMWAKGYQSIGSTLNQFT